MTGPEAQRVDGEHGSPRWRRRLFWKLQAIGWGGTFILAVLFSALEYSSHTTILYLWGARAALGVLVTSLLRYGYRRLRRSGGNLWLKAGGVCLLCGALGWVDGLGTLWIAPELGVETEGYGMKPFLMGSILMRWMLYWLWSILYFGINYWLDTEHARLRLAQAEAAARSSELQLLRAQVNPHFLFNALNSILAESDNAGTVRALTMALAEYLRFSFQAHGDREPLGVELDALENYLRVEKARFEEKLEYRIEAAQAARDQETPIALVQPLLDNAIKYGQRSAVRPVRVAITARKEGGELVITVTNTGQWEAGGHSGRAGTGLANLRRRLQLSYGEAAALTTAEGEGEVVVQVRVPLMASGAMS